MRAFSKKKLFGGPFIFSQQRSDSQHIMLNAPKRGKVENRDFCKMYGKMNSNIPNATNSVQSSNLHSKLSSNLVNTFKFFFFFILWGIQCYFQK